jgi:hypothetical protein
VAPRGSTVELHNDSHQYPSFEVQFIGKSPASPDDTLTGSNETPITLNMSHEGGVYVYNIKHTDAKGSSVMSGPFSCSVHPCGGCP